MDVIREIRELKSQLAYAKNLGFFFGAGTSCSIGIPNVATLTNTVEAQLAGIQQEHFRTIKAALTPMISGRDVNIEDILNQVRRIREITSDSAGLGFININGEHAKALDKRICELIYSIIDSTERAADITVPRRFFAWLNSLSHEFTKEVFTTNYDLVVEKALEACRLPYFDGFVGAHEPFFLQDSVERFVDHTDLTTAWVRLWKLHGSLSWFWKSDGAGTGNRIIRVGKFDATGIPDNELVVYPSKDKYDSSRKQPFIAYFDRLKNYLLNGELLFVITGYSFSDQHINEILFNCLRQNNRLYVVSFCYQDSEVDRLGDMISSASMNMGVFGPRKSIINGALENWACDRDALSADDRRDLYWDVAGEFLKLGDFASLVEFLVASSGRSQFIERTLV